MQTPSRPGTVVTGGSRGIGAATAVRPAETGLLGAVLCAGGSRRSCPHRPGRRDRERLLRGRRSGFAPRVRALRSREGRGRRAHGRAGEGARRRRDPGERRGPGDRPYRHPRGRGRPWKPRPRVGTSLAPDPGSPGGRTGRRGGHAPAGRPAGARRRGREAVAQGWTWAQVGEALGISVIAAKKAAARTAAERTDGAARPTSATTSTHAAG
jgi:hypothetical protein